METEEHLKKGEKGEKYISQKLKEFGYKIFYPENKFEISDRIILCERKKTFHFAQFKYKELRIIRADTGISKNQYERYKREQEIYHTPMIILFTDNSGEIYGEWLDELDKCEPKEFYNKKDNQTMICWLRNKLKDYKELLY